jgi:catalase (peroxidase I)
MMIWYGWTQRRMGSSSEMLGWICSGLEKPFFFDLHQYTTHYIGNLYTTNWADCVPC